MQPSTLLADCTPAGDTVNDDVATFLLNVMGLGVDPRGQRNFIIMCAGAPNPDDPRDRKYTTVKRDPRLSDTQGHVRGDITIGGCLTHGAYPERARLVAVDSDSGRDFSRLERAAPKLVATGACPFLETVTLPEEYEHAGGGKLWFAFADWVNWRHALATAVHYAPELVGLEHYPPGRVRLPGGMYRRGVNKWTELKAIGADDDSWYTGEPAIRTVMENLTPASWVTQRSAPGAREPGPIAEGPIPYSQRNSLLFRMGCSMRRAGFHESAILAALRVTNTERCEPLLEDDEVIKIALSSTRYSPGTLAASGAHRPMPSLRVRWVGRHD